jgi:cytochrome c553
MLNRALIIFGVVASLAGPAWGAGDPTAGKTKAAGCAGCHGANGQGVPPNPPLAGMSEAQFIQAIDDYKTGKRNNAVMKALSTPLSTQDIDNLAAYYASLKK